MNRNPARPPGAPPALRLTPPRSTLPGAPDGHTAFFASLLDRFGTTPELADPGQPPHMGGGAAERDPAAAPHVIGNGPIAPSDLYPPPRRKPAALLLPFSLIDRKSTRLNSSHVSE